MARRINGFDVYLGNNKIDTVFYGSDFFRGFKTLKEVKESIKKSLVEHDGYNPNITII